jgi:hypothetical protein
VRSNGLDADVGIVSKMQARSVDPAVEADRKVSRRCRRVKGRIERHFISQSEDVERLTA